MGDIFFVVVVVKTRGGVELRSEETEREREGERRERERRKEREARVRDRESWEGREGER